MYQLRESLVQGSAAGLWNGNGQARNNVGTDGSDAQTITVFGFTPMDRELVLHKFKVREVTFSFLCPLLEKYGTFIARCNALIEKVSALIELR
eukprot:SAG31_NODE_9924_length_1209_cov_1.432432_3_plen_93_part_00